MGGRRIRVVVVVVAALVSVLVAGAAGADRGTLQLRLSSSDGLRLGQTIDYVVRGRAVVAGAVVDVWQCDADADLEVGSTLEDLNRSCNSLDGRVVQERERAVVGTVTVQEVLTTQPAVHCGDEPDDCIMVALVLGNDPAGTIEALDVVPIDVVPSPVAVGGPGLLEGDGTVDVWVSGTPGATLTLAQCVRFPGVSRDLARCQVGPTVVLSGTGRAATEMAVVSTLDVDGRTYDCRRRPCQVTLFDQAGGILGAVDIPGSVPYADVNVEPSTGLRDRDIIRARIDSAIPIDFASNYSIAICLASVIDDLVPPTEGCYVFSPVVEPGVHDYELIAYERFVPVGGGPEVSCRDDPRGCIIGVGTATTASGYAPISFASPADTGLTVSADTATLGADHTSVVLAGSYACGPFASGRPDRGVIDLSVEQVHGRRTVTAFGFLEPTVCDGTSQPFAVTLTGTGGQRFRVGPATWIGSGYVEGDTGLQHVQVPPTAIIVTQ